MRRYQTRHKLFFYMGLFALLSSVTGGCREFSGADYLPSGHPADPVSRDGLKARMSSSLIPENLDIRPEVSAARPPKTLSPNRKMNGSGQAMSGHRGSH